MLKAPAGANPIGMGTTAPRRYTTKQMGDACEMIVAAELTLAGIPALKVPDNWPGYDVIAQPFDRPAQRVSVKSRTFKRGAAMSATTTMTNSIGWRLSCYRPMSSRLAQSTLSHGKRPSGWRDVIKQPVKPLRNDTSGSIKSLTCLQHGTPTSI
ncbi:hypothetical protein ABID26_004584 [Mesorhizobium shonense]|uniref:Uncharacterized protein n=1 Tax=Mesorhizobium shonense TaxID=1209948 RepID=A0ABV2HYK4_9HYPH